MDDVIGKTRSGITITLLMDVATVTDLGDAFDALAIFEAFALHEKIRRGVTDVYDQACDRVERLHLSLLSGCQLDLHMQTLGLKTYADRVKFGSQLLNRAYRDR